jgi:eukaryotic-like serine/threonine-protein kinase
MPVEKGSFLQQRYRVEDIIAKGGMGAVYRAIDESLGIAVALKENFFTNEESTRQFRREATILASLRHPNLPRVTDHFVIPGQGQYLVMDFIEGSDLRDFINQRGTLTEEEVVRIGITICDALAYLHSRNPAIVHRDIKPGNLKITPSGQVYLVDFGLAKITRGEATTTGAQALTPGYAPPEQYGQGTEPRSDIYSFGATLYAALTGKLPEDGLSRVMGSATLTPVRTHNPQVSPAIARVVERSMATQVNDRYQNADAFKMALQDAAAKSIAIQAPAQPEENDSDATVLEDLAAQVGAASKAQPEKGTADGEKRKAISDAPRSKKIPAAFYSIGIVAFVALLAWLLLNLPSQQAAIPLPDATWTLAPSAIIMDTEPPAATHTPEPSPTASPAPTETLLPTETPVPTPTETLPPAATPIGGGTGQIAFASDRSGQVQVWVMDADGSNARQVTQLSDGACQPDWSSDGQRLVFVSPCSGKKEEYPRANMFLINADGTGLIMLNSLPGGDFDPAWSPDGSMIAFTTLRNNNIPHLYLYNLNDNTTRRLSRQLNRERHSSWSPDGKLLAHQTSRLGKLQIWTIDVETEEVKEFSDLAGSQDSRPDWAPDGSIIIFSQGNPAMLVARQVGKPFAQQVTVSDAATMADNVSFSPDGRWLSFDSRKDGVVSIYRMKVNGGELTRITDDASLNFDPVWRP